METPCWCPSKGHQHGGCKVAEISIIEKMMISNEYQGLRLLPL